MMPVSVGQTRKDWVQIFIALIWATVIGIMLLAKMKAVQDVLILFTLCLGAGKAKNLL